MKRFLFIATILVAFSLTSCLSDNETEQYYLRFGSLSGESANNFVINTDDNLVLKPQGAIQSSSISKPFKFVDGKRVVVQFSIISGVDSTSNYNVSVVAIEDFYEKDILFVNEESPDTLKNNPVSMAGPWIGKDYLNIEFYFRGGDVKEFPHSFDLVYDSTNQDNEKYVFLDLMHNANGDTLSSYYSTFRVLMSVSLKDFKSCWSRFNFD